MSMLSRVAERLYWMARYLERTEVTARLCNAYSQLILDIPKGSALGWETLITIVNGDNLYHKRYTIVGERNILKFMIMDLDNSGSVCSSVKAARENVRTTRDVLPGELWELINEFYMFVDESAEKTLVRRSRFDFLHEVIARCQQINGLIESAVSRDHAYSFLKMGRLIERSDMTSRTIDTAVASVLNHQSEEKPDFTLVWAGLLKSLSASSAYRREIGPMVDGDDVFDFLFRNGSFPRSVYFCLLGIEEVLSQLKNNDAVSEQLDNTIEMVLEIEAGQTSLKDKHQLIDKLQKQLIGLNNLIADTWFDMETK